MILFPDIKDVARNTSVTSDEYTVTEDATISIVGTSPVGISATLLRNGADVGQSYSAQVGDMLQVSMQSSPQFADPQHVILDVGGKHSFWTVTTVQDTVRYINPGFADLDPYALTHDIDGVSYFPHPANNEIAIFDNAGTGLGEIDIARPQEGSIDWSHVVVVSHHDNYIHFIDPLSRQHVGSLSLEGKPYQIARVLSDPDDVDSEPLVFVTLADLDYVSVLNYGGAQVETIPTGIRPMGIAVSPDGKHVWIANNGENTVLHLEWMNGSWSRSTIAVASKPLDVVCDSGFAYVTCAGSDKVYRIASDDSSDAIVVGANPRNLCATPTGIWISIHGERKVVKFNGSGVIASVVVDNAPYSICELQSGNMVVTCFDTSSVIEFNDLGVVRTRIVKPFPYRVESVGNEVWVMSMWSGTPSYMYYHDRSPYSFVLDVPEEMKRGVTFKSNDFTVAGITQETRASLVPGYNGAIYKNGINSGVRTLVNAGDTIHIELQTPTAEKAEIDTCLYVGSESCRFTAETNIIDVTVDPFTLDKVLNATRNTLFTSNEITISGLESGITSLLTISAGTIVLNDVVQSTSSVIVQNGDKLRFRMTSANDWSTPSFCLVSVGHYETVWTIFTTAPAEDTWYMLPRDKGKTIHDVIDFPSLPVAFVDRSKNVLRQYSLSSLTEVNSYNLEEQPLENGLTNAPRVYSVDPYDKRMILVDIDDATQNGVERVYPLEGIPYGLSAGPMVAMSQLATSHFVSLYDKDKLVMLGGAGGSLLVQAGTKPMGIACSNYNQLYVAGSDGFLHIFDYNEAQAKFTFSTMMGIPDGGRLCDILVDDSTLYISDLTLGAVHKMVGGLYIDTIRTGLLPYSMTQSGTHVYTVNFGSSTVSMFPKAGGNVMTVELPYGASQPNCVAYDSTGGRLFVGCSRAEKVYVLDSTTLELITVLSNVGPVWGLQIVGANLLILNMWGNLLESKLVGYPRQSPVSLVFDQVTDAELGTKVQSTSRFVSEPLARVEKIWIEPFADAAIIKNGVRVGWETTIVENDQIRLEMKSVNDFDALREVRLYGYKYSTPFGVRTMKDVFPDKFVFPTVQNVLPKTWAESVDMEISGLDPTVTVPIKAVYSSLDHPFLDLTLWVNDVVVENEWAEVKNGDRVRVGCNSYWLPWNGYSTYIHLETDREFRFGTLRIRSSYLDNAIRPPFKIDSFRGPDGVEVDQTYTLDVSEIQLTPLGQPLYAFRDQIQFDAEYGTILPRVVSEVQLDVISNRLSSIYYPEFDVAIERSTRRSAEAMYSVEIKYGTTHHLIEQSEARQTATYEHRSRYLSSNDGAIGVSNWTFNESLNVIFDGAEHSQVKVIAVKTNSMESEFAGKVRRSLWSLDVTYSKSRNYAKHFVWTYSQQSVRRHTYFTDVLYNSRGPRDHHNFTFEFLVEGVGTIAPASAFYTFNNLKSVPKTATDWKRDIERSRYFTASGYNWLYSSAPIRVSTGYSHGESSRFWKAGAEYTGRVRRGQARTDVTYKAREFRASGKVSASYQRTLRINPASFSQASVRYANTGGKKSPVAQYTRPSKVHFDDFVYTSSMIRAFDTADQAIAAGQAQQHPVVYAKEMWDSFYMWHVPAEIERVECANTALQARYVRGYIQGG